MQSTFKSVRFMNAAMQDSFNIHLFKRKKMINVELVQVRIVYLSEYKKFTTVNSLRYYLQLLQIANELNTNDLFTISAIRLFLYLCSIKFISITKL